MSDFLRGTRVRILDVPETAPYGGRAGEIVSVNRTTAGGVFSYYVRLDGDFSHASRMSDVLFRPGELEAELGPQENTPRPHAREGTEP